MRSFLSSVFLFISIALMGQSVVSVKVQTENLTWRGKELKRPAKILQFSQNIWQYDIDYSHEILYVISHKGTDNKPHRKGTLTVYDLNKEKELWHIPFNPKMDNFLLIDSIPMVFSGYFTTAYNCHSGLALWNFRGQFVGSTKGMDLGIVYYPDYKDHSHIFGVNYGTGQKIWERSTPYQHYLDKIEFVGDTAWIAESHGIDYTHLWKGEGWHHKVKTPVSLGNPGAITMGYLLGGVIGGVIAGAITSSTGQSLLTGSTQRRWAVEGRSIYFVGHKSVYKFNERGQVRWQAFFDKNLTGTARLFRSDKDIFVVHNGLTIAADGYTKFGPSGIDKFGHKNGLAIAHSYFEETIRDYLVKDSTVMIALDTKIVELRLSDLSILKEKVFATTQGVKIGFKEIMNPPGFIKTDSLYLNTTVQSPGYFYASNKAGMKIEFDEDFEISKVIREDDYFYLHRKLFDMRIIKNVNGMIWINNRGEDIMGLIFSDRMKYRKERIYDLDQRKVLVYPANYRSLTR